MVSRTTLAGLTLALAALVLALRIVSPSEGAAVSSVLAPVAEASPSAIAISSDGEETARIVRSQDGWSLAPPNAGRADTAVVERLLSALCSENVRDRVSARQLTRRGLKEADYGLSPPRAAVSLSFAGMDDFSIAFGDESPGGGVFAKTSAGSDVMVVASAVLEALPRTLERCRDRALMPVGVNPPVAFEIRRKGEPPLKLEKNQSGKWVVTAPFPSPADQDAAEKIYSGFVSPAIRRFIAPPGAGDASGEAARRAYGISPEEASVSVSVWSRGSISPETFLFGAEDPSEPGLVVAASSDGAVFSVDGALLQTVETPLEELRDKRVFPFSPKEVRRFSVRVPEREMVELRREEDGTWAFSSPTPARTAPGAVDAYLENLLSWCDSSVMEESANAENPGGKGESRAIVAIFAEDDAPAFEGQVLEFPPDGGAPGFWAARSAGGDAATRVLDEDADPAAAFSDGAIAALRDKTVLALERDAIVSAVPLDSDGRPFDCDENSTAAVVALATNFTATAVSSVSSTDETAWGLARPRAQWSFSTSIRERPVVILQLGSGLEDGSSFARVKGDGAVFVARPEDAAKLLAGRDGRNKEEKE